MNTYLGDAVYASDEINPGHITLTTGSHKLEEADQIIHLDETVCKALLHFLAKLKQANKQRDANLIISKIPEDLRSSAEIFGENQVDLNNLEHTDALRVMKALNLGRWERRESGYEGKLDYVAKFNDWTVRLWAAGPPDSCRVVEEEYEIPAVPASMGKRKRVICAKSAEVAAEAPPADEQSANPTF